VTKSAPLPGPVVFVVDDDGSMRTALSSLFRSVGLRVELFGSAPEFLQSKLADVPSCLVLDIRLPGPSGLDFQAELAKANIHIPIIFMTGHGDIPMTVRAMKAGAVDFLTKPVKSADLLAAIERAIALDRESRRARHDVAEVSARIETLTPREREVMALVVAGRLNKQIAHDLGASIKTIKVHRARVMAKMGVRTVADLVRATGHAGIAGPPAADE
jgi:FixJ family two-component response regulator